MDAAEFWKAGKSWTDFPDADAAEFWKEGKSWTDFPDAAEFWKAGKSWTDFPDVYDWICHFHLSKSECLPLPLNDHCGKAGLLFLESEIKDIKKVGFFVSSNMGRHFDLGMCDTGIVGRESRQKNTFQIFSNMFARVYFNAFEQMDIPQMDIPLGTIHSAKYEKAFDSLFSVACFCFLKDFRFKISEGELHKLPCHQAEDVLSIIGIPTQTYGFPDVYDWVSRLDRKRSKWREVLPLNVYFGEANPLFLFSEFTASEELSLSLSSAVRKLFDLGIVGEESRQKNTFQVFLNLCACVYLKAFDPDLVKLEQTDIQLGTIESAKYKQAFNSLFSLACYSFLKHSRYEISESEAQKLCCHRAEDVLSTIGPAATACLLRRFSAEFAYKYALGKSDNKVGNELSISHCSSSLPGFWIINSYCTMLSMARTTDGQIADKKLSNALTYQQLQCILQFRHVVNVFRDFIEVKLEIDSVGCDVIRLDPPHKPIPTRLKDERHFPAQISITVGPEVESQVHSVSLTKSSQNPVTDIERGRTVEATFEPPKYPGLKVSKATKSQNSMKSWEFEQTSVNRPHVNLEWTLYDSTTGKAVSNYKPQRFSVFNSKTWSGDRYSKACRAFTARGGVLFAGDEYGQPITWRLRRDLEGQIVNWVVKGEICLAYFPNNYRSSHVEIANHQFCQVVQFPLLQSTPN